MSIPKMSLSTTEAQKEELVDRLRWVRICRRTEKEIDVIETSLRPKKNSFRCRGKSPDEALRYFNKCFCMELDEFAPEVWFDDVAARVLFDLVNLPLEMVFDRLKKDFDTYELPVLKQ